MFYVKGAAFLSSLSWPTTSGNGPVTPSQDEPQDTGAEESVQKHSDLATYRDSFGVVFPVMLLVAALLPMLAVLYTATVLPVALEEQFAAFADAGNNRTRAPMHPRQSLPLVIDCPTLKPRNTPPASVYDLRPDDIRVVAALGDSIMAGFAAKGIQKRFLSMDSLEENRGISFAMGGDPNAITLPNVIRYYAPRLYGASVGDHLITICFGGKFCPQGQYRPSQDVLNGAQTGARSMNLQHELDYVLGQLDDAYKSGVIQPSDWKLLTIFIGSNDLCHTCTTLSSRPAQFQRDVQQAIDRIRSSVRNVFVQMIGVLQVGEAIAVTQNHPEYCQPLPMSSFVMHDHECECAHSAANMSIMSEMQPQYNAALEQIAQTVILNDTFALVYQPFHFNVASLPIQAFSDIDCFHPSEITHRWFAKQLWHMMFLQSSEKQAPLTFNPYAPIFCPSEADRFQVL